MSSWPLLSAENRSFAEVLERIARERLDGHSEAMEEENELPTEAHAVLVENELWSVGLPAKHGGSDAGLETLSLVVGHVATALPAVAVTIADTHVAAAAAVECSNGVGTQTLAAIAGGSSAAVIDGASPLVDATLTSEDGAWGLSVEASRAEGVEAACASLVLTEDRAALVTGTADHVSGPELRRAGLRGVRAHPVRFDERLDSGAVIDHPAAGLRAMRHVLLCAAALGVAAAAEHHARAYAAERRQFGRSIDAIPAVRDKLKRAAREIRTAQAEVIATARDLDVGVDRATADAVELAVWVTAGSLRIALEMTQVLGGYGYLREYPIEHAVRDAMTIRASASAALPAGAA